MTGGQKLRKEPYHKVKRGANGRLGIFPALIMVCLCLLLPLCFPCAAYAESGGTAKADNGIPVVYLNIDESRGSIDEMIGSIDHSVYCYGTVSITVPDGFRYSDFPDMTTETLTDLEMSLRGRGNSTWEHSAKKPFKIKLEESADVLGLGSSKHWVLLANHFDQTLLRDRITAWLGDELGFEFTPRGVPVDLVLSGEEYGTHYLGSYYLSENVRVGENRLDIDELKKEDSDPLTITGGYLIQNSYQVRKGSPDRFRTSRGAEWATHTPSFDTDEGSGGMLGLPGEEPFAEAELGDGYENTSQMQYIQDYVQYFEDVLYEQGTAYRDLMDLPSAAKYWLIQTFSLNGDAYATGSTYFYKTRDTQDGPGRIYWGPLWDFDFAWDKQLRTYGLPYGHEWIKPMLYDTGDGGFVQELHRQWAVMRDALIRLSEDGGVIDRYRDETRASAQQDRNIYFPDAEGSYDEDVEALKEWIRERIAWFDENFGMVDDLVHKVVFMADGEICRTEFKSVEEYIEGTEEHPDKDGYVFIGWMDEQGTVIDSQRPVTGDMILTAKYLSDREATHGRDIAFSRGSDVIRYNVHIFQYQIPYTVIPDDAVDRKIKWSSSDEDYATVDDEGLVTFDGPGTVTLTASLRFGRSRQFTLTVLDGDLPAPSSASPEEEKIVMAVGDQHPFIISTEPPAARIDEYSYVSDDENIVTVGEFGTLTAVSPGTATVRVTAVTYADGTEDTVLETSVTVTVMEQRKTSPGTGAVLAALSALMILLAAASLLLFRTKKGGHR